MSEEMSTPFLPLGSILRLQDTGDDQLLYLVVARAIAKNEVDEIISRYKVAPHPFGDVPSQEVFTVSADQIVEVVFEGYSDQEDEAFLNELLERMANGPAPVAAPITPEPEISEEAEVVIVMDENQKLQEDPFYKFRT